MTLVQSWTGMSSTPDLIEEICPRVIALEIHRIVLSLKRIGPRREDVEAERRPGTSFVMFS